MYVTTKSELRQMLNICSFFQNESKVLMKECPNLWKALYEFIWAKIWGDAWKQDLKWIEKCSKEWHLDQRGKHKEGYMTFIGGR